MCPTFSKIGFVLPYIRFKETIQLKKKKKKKERKEIKERKEGRMTRTGKGKKEKEREKERKYCRMPVHIKKKIVTFQKIHHKFF